MKKSKEKTPQKPRAKLIGADGNVFNLLGIASKALKRAGLGDEAREMQERVFKAASFDEALSIMTEYVDVH